MTSIDAMVLTGGTASRIRPLSIGQVKCMLPFMGRPILYHMVRSLESAGYRDLIFSSSGKDKEIADYFLKGEKLGVAITYADDEPWFGTAGTVKRLVEILQQELSDPFLLAYGDSLLSADLSDMLQFHREHASLCTILYHHPRLESFLYEYHDRPRKCSAPRTNFGVMEVDAQRFVTKFIEKPKLKDIPDLFRHPVANAAIYIVQKEIFRLVPSDRIFDFAENLFPLLVQQRLPFYGFDSGDGYRIDLGLLSHYYTANMWALRRSLNCHVDFPSVGDRIWIGKRTKTAKTAHVVTPALICEDVRIGPNTTIVGSIIGNSAKIGSDCYVRESLILDNVEVQHGARIDGSIIGDHSVIAEDISLLDSVIGSYCRVGKASLRMEDSEFAGLVRE